MCIVSNDTWKKKVYRNSIKENAITKKKKNLKRKWLSGKGNRKILYLWIILKRDNTREKRLSIHSYTERSILFSMHDRICIKGSFFSTSFSSTTSKHSKYLRCNKIVSVSCHKYLFGISLKRAIQLSSDNIVSGWKCWFNRKAVAWSLIEKLIGNRFLISAAFFLYILPVSFFFFFRLKMNVYLALFYLRRLNLLIEKMKSKKLDKSHNRIGVFIYLFFFWSD